jgi:putative MATE family efflux protein
MSLDESPPGPVPPLPQEPARAPPARFVTGSILRHILVMTGTSAVGLMAIFAGDFANILFLGLLGDVEVLAAVGYASSILFFTVSVGIGLAIATTSLVSPALGAGELARARRLSANLHVASAVVAILIVLAMWPSLRGLLAWLGAGGRTLDLAHGYTRIIIPSLPLLIVGMCSSAVLRSVGDPRRAMYVTLAGAIVNTALDPIFIFALGLGINGTAIASVIARVCVAAVGLHAVIGVHGLMARPEWAALRRDVPLIARFVLPAVLANVATPVSNAFVTMTIAGFSDAAVAAWAVIGRITPVAFGAIFALSGAVGPIIGQNLGAKSFTRVRLALTEALRVAVYFTAAAWVVLALAAPALVSLFGATGEAAELITFYCRWVAPLFVFFGTLFVSNAACNTLGRPHYATLLNWGRATLGTLPFTALGATWAGAKGVLIGYMAGGIVFGLIAVAVVFRLIARLERADSAESRRANQWSWF